MQLAQKKIVGCLPLLLLPLLIPILYCTYVSVYQSFILPFLVTCTWHSQDWSMEADFRANWISWNHNRDGGPGTIAIQTTVREFTPNITGIFSLHHSLSLSLDESNALINQCFYSLFHSKIPLISRLNRSFLLFPNLITHGFLSSIFLLTFLTKRNLLYLLPSLPFLSSSISISLSICQSTPRRIPLYELLIFL